MRRWRAGCLPLSDLRMEFQKDHPKGKRMLLLLQFRKARYHQMIFIFRMTLSGTQFPFCSIWSLSKLSILISYLSDCGGGINFNTALILRWFERVLIEISDDQAKYKKRGNRTIWSFQDFFLLIRNQRWRGDIEGYGIHLRHEKCPISMPDKLYLVNLRIFYAKHSKSRY